MYFKKAGKSFVMLVLTFCMVMQMAAGTNASAQNRASSLSVSGLQCDYTANPMGIDSLQPSLSWKITSAEKGVMQTSYRIMVSSSKDRLDGGAYDMWDSGTIQSDASIGILYGGAPLQPETRYYWKVTVTDNKGNTAASTEKAYWETGLMDAGWDHAQWIGKPTETNPGKSLTKFTIDVDFTVLQDAFGLIFGAKDDKNFYMWQVNTVRGAVPLLRPHRWTNGKGARIEPETDISCVYPTKESVLNHPGHMQLAVNNGEIKTYLNGTLVDTRTVPSFELGNVGFRAVRTGTTENERALADNLIVRDENGIVVLKETFGSGNHFTGGKIENGQISLENCLIFREDQASDDQTQQAAPMLRKEFSTKGKKIESARLYATAAGIYDFYVNGQKISRDYFNPGRTTLRNRVMYQTFDVTSFLQNGENAVGAIVGNGWYVLDRITYGNYHSLYAKLVIRYDDGSSDTIVTDTSWEYTGSGPLLQDDFYQGETYDANRELPGWSEPGYNDSDWVQAGTQPQEVVGIGEIVSQVGPPVRSIQTLPALSVSEPQPGNYVYDFGQNFAGTVRISLTGSKGQTVQLRYGEMLNDTDAPARGCDGPAGTIYTANLRSAKNTDRYIMKGDPSGETFEPSYVYHGFRYLEVTGIDAPLPLTQVVGVVLSSEMERTGTFECSNPLVNQLYSNTVWGQKSNFISVPTDCPQRDERRGFTGDAQIFARTAMYNMDTQAFYTKFMQDICDNQTADGAFPHMAPSLDGYVPVAGGWMDAGIIIPWQMYQQYGNTQIIRQHYDAMRKYMNYLLNTSPGYIRDMTKYGDWLSVGESTPNGLMDTAFCAYSSALMAKMAAVIGKDQDAVTYQTMSDNFKAAWQNKFVRPDGTLSSGSQTGYALGIYFDLFRPEQMEIAAQALVKDIEDHGSHLTTGFVGISYLNPALSAAGRSDTAYRLLEQKSYPSWLYPVLQGATTMWERWNSYTVENGFGDPGMNSFNHYAYGSIVEWLYRETLGIERDEEKPAFKHIILQPTPGGSLTSAKGSYDSVYGTIRSEWSIHSGSLHYNASIPANTTATVYLPVSQAGAVVVNGKPADQLDRQTDGIAYIKTENGKAVFEAASGSFAFETPISETVSLTVRQTEQTMKSRLTVDGKTQVLTGTASVTVPAVKGKPVTLEIVPFDDVDYAASWEGYPDQGGKITVTPDEDSELTAVFLKKSRPNLALNANVTTNSKMEALPTWSVPNLVDGVLNHLGGSNGYCSDKSSSPEFDPPIEINVDLGEIKEFNQFRLYPRTDTATPEGGTVFFPSDYEISVSGDHQNYRKVFEVKDQQAPFWRPEVIQLDSACSARYIRIKVYQTGNRDNTSVSVYRCQLAEFGAYRVADTSGLAQTLAEAKAYRDKEGEYTADSWKAFTDAYEAAAGVLADETAEQKTVDAAKAALGSVVSRLVKLGDKTGLNALLAQAKAKQLSDYTKATAEKLREAIQKAEAVAADSQATEADVAKAAADLQNAVSKLVKLGDKTGLNALLVQVKAKRLSEYTEATAEKLKAAIQKAEAVAADGQATEADVAKAAADLQDAVSKLVKLGDKTGLNAVLAQAKTKRFSDYTDATAEKLKTAIQKAESVAADSQATEADVAKAEADLQNAVSKLVKLGDKTGLNALLAQAKGKRLSDYTEATADQLKGAIRKAEAVAADGQATEADVAKAEADLQDALNGLKAKDTASSESSSSPENPSSGNLPSSSTPSGSAPSGSSSAVLNSSGNNTSPQTGASAFPAVGILVLAMVSLETAVLVKRKK